MKSLWAYRYSRVVCTASKVQAWLDHMPQVKVHIGSLLLSLIISSSAMAQGWAITLVAPSGPSEPPVCTHCEGTQTGYVWHYSDGQQVVESYAEYVARGKAPRLTCSTGFCKKASAGPVKPSAGCRCGCNAATCNCAHSRNVGTEIEMLGRSMGTVFQSCPSGTCRRAFKIRE